MEVIDSRGTKQVIHDGDDIIKVHVGSELMWKMATKSVGVYTRDEVDLDGLSKSEATDVCLYADGFFSLSIDSERPIKYIEVNDQFIEVLDGEEIRFRERSSINIERFNKLQAEKLFGVTVEGEFIELKGLVNVYGWY